MSWDILLLRTKTNDEADLEQVTEEAVIPWERSAVVAWLKAHYPEADTSDESWLTLTAEQYAVEFALGEEEVIQTIPLLIHGNEAPLALIAQLCVDFDCRAVDCGDGQWLDCSDNSSFERWRNYRDKVLAEYHR